MLTDNNFILSVNGKKPSDAQTNFLLENRNFSLNIHFVIFGFVSGFSDCFSEFPEFLKKIHFLKKY